MQTMSFLLNDADELLTSIEAALKKDVRPSVAAAVASAKQMWEQGNEIDAFKMIEDVIRES